MSRRGIGVLVLVLSLLSLTGAPAQAVVPDRFDQDVWQTDGRVRAVVETPSAIFVAGDFANLVGPDDQLVPRANLAALDPVTGAPLDWRADARGSVWGLALSPDNSTLYVGGQFTRLNRVARMRAGAVSTATAEVTAFNPVVTGRVRSLATIGNQVYLGGDFTAIAGAARNRLAAVDAGTGVLNPNWVATANARVHTVVASPNGAEVYVGGRFKTIATWPVANLALLDATTGAPRSLASPPAHEVIDIAVDDDQLFAAVGGASNRATAWDLATGAMQWSVRGDGDPQALAVQNDALYVGGHFTRYDYVHETGHLVAVDPATGTLLDWNVRPNSNLGVFELTSYNGHLNVGGDFTKINWRKRGHFARFSE